MANQGRAGPEIDAALEGLLSSYLPYRQVERLAARGTLPTAAIFERRSGALLFADISGFTSVTERLAPRGPRGAEQLSEILNRYYGRMVELIDEHGGDVIAFAGDAALVLWDAPSRGGHPDDAGGRLDDDVLSAARCALAMQRELSGFDAGENIRLQMRSCVGAGDLQCYELGGIANRWLWLVAGEPLEQVSLIDALTRPGDVVLSREAARRLAQRGLGVSLENGALRLATLTAPGSSALPKRPALQRIDASDLGACVPEIVATRLAAGHGEFLAEFRRMTVAFIALRYGSRDRDVSVARLQRCVTLIQQQIDHYDGAIYQCLRDDKGFVVVGAFGMPPRAHEDDAVRGSLAALSIREKLREIDETAAIGVTTGRLFCGTYGGVSRRQYSLVGSAMNLAARLMQAAGGDGVLCDEITERAAGRAVRFGEPREIHVKGRDDRVRTYAPLSRHSGRGTAPGPRLCGRQEELAHLVRRASDLASGRRVGCVVVEAEAGMGKSTLLDALDDRARELDIRVLRGDGDAIESGTPHFPFRGVFRQLFADGPGADSAPLEDRVRQLLRESPDLHPLIPLARSVLPLGVPDNDLTRQMTGQIRADNLVRLLVQMMRAAANELPTLVLLEDAHWMDTASWALTLAIARSVDAAFVTLSTRPLDEPPSEYTKLLELPDTARVDLVAMGSDELAELVARQLGVDTLPDALAEAVTRRAEGNPFYAQELALSLRDAGLIEVQGDRLVVSTEQLEEVSFPDSLHGVITSRVDRLPAATQLTLKVASVIGRVFETRMLEEIHPIEGDAAHVSSHLEELVDADLVVVERTGGAPAYAFRHAFTHDSVYGLLPYAQRRPLHRAAAEHLKSAHGADLSPVYPRLAHHYDEAEMPAQAMDAHNFAGRQALDAYANKETIRFLDRALELDAAHEPGFSALQRAEVHRFLGIAHYGLSDYDRVREAQYAALREAGFREPRGGFGLLVELGVLLRHRLRQRLTGQRARQLDGDDWQRCVCAMYALGDLSPALAFEGKRLAFAQATIQTFNLTAHGEGYPEQGAARAAYGILLAMVGLRSASEREVYLAVQEASVQPDLFLKITTFVGFSMVLVLLGRSEEACPWLERADAHAAELGTGLWRHRAKYVLGDALTCLGRYEEAVKTLDEAAEIARDAEPSVVGFMRALGAVALLRLGRSESALGVIEEGIAISREHPAGLPLFASLGALSDARLRLGDLAGALESAMEAEAISRRGGEVSSYFPGIHGFSGICSVYLELWRRAAEREASPLGAAEARRRARRACRAFARFVRIFPAARPRYLLMEGLRQQTLGRAGRAERHWRRAASLAEEMGQPFELGLAHYHLGLGARGDARRLAMLRAEETFARHGMTHELSLVLAAREGVY